MVHLTIQALVHNAPPNVKHVRILPLNALFVQQIVLVVLYVIVWLDSKKSIQIVFNALVIAVRVKTINVSHVLVIE